MDENRTTTKIFKEDLDALRKLKKDHKLHGIADTISWLLDQHEASMPAAMRDSWRICLVIEENSDGQLRVEAMDAKK